MTSRVGDIKNAQRAVQLLLVLVWFQLSVADPSYGVWVVDTSHATNDPIVVDVDGNGLKDLVIPQYFPTTGRELHIYLQEAHEKLSNSPLKIEIKSEAIGFSLADVRETAGAEIIWITADAIYSFSANLQGYVGNLEHLSDWELFVRHPDSRELLYVEAVDLNDDGARDLVLPGPNRYGVFLNRVNKRLGLVASLELLKPSESTGIEQIALFPNRSLDINTFAELNDEGEVSLYNVFIFRSQYQSLFSPDSQESFRTRTINYGSWQRGVIPRDVDGDSIVDLVSRSPSGLRVSHLRSDMDKRAERLGLVESLAGAPSSSNLVSYEIPFQDKPVSSLEDVDGDGDLDIVSIAGGITSSTVHLMVNDGGQFNAEAASQVLRVGGMIVHVEFSRIHGEERPYMLINTVTAPLRKLMTEIELHRNLLMYRPDETGNGVFDRKPSLTSTQSINIDTLSNLMPGTVRFDLDFDGANDLLESKSDGTVQARRIDEFPQLASRPFWRFTPEFAVFSVSTDDLNDDQVPDLILEHSTAVTYLVSRR